MRRWLAGSLTIALAWGCSTTSGKGGANSVWRHAPNIPTAPKKLEAALEKSLGATMVGGNKAELVDNGAIFDALEQMTRGARSSIHVDIYIWQPFEASLRLARTIAQRAKAGVACRVVFDSFGSPDFDQIRTVLAPAGCELLEFRPIKGDLLHALNRDHRKIVVVDGKIAITGGFGIDRAWLGNGRSKDQWRDSNVRLEGPIVAQLQDAFAQDWRKLGGKPLPASAFPRLEPVGSSRAALVISGPRRDTDKLSAAEKMVRFLMGAAKHRLWIANSYFVPSDEIIQMLIEKAKAGLDVRVLAPGKNDDSATTRAAQRATYAELMAGGVRIFEYEPSMMHAKTVLVDDRLVAIGSINMDPLSLKKAEEDTVILEDSRLAAAQTRDFRKDLRLSMEVHKAPKTPVNHAARNLLWFVGKRLPTGGSPAPRAPAPRP